MQSAKTYRIVLPMSVTYEVLDGVEKVNLELYASASVGTPAGNLTRWDPTPGTGRDLDRKR
jgi:hypothetical protein